MRARAGGRGRGEGQGPRRQRGRQEPGSSMPPSEGRVQGRVSAGEGGGGRPPRSPATSSRARGGACPRQLLPLGSAPALGALVLVGASECVRCLPLSCRPHWAGAAAPERFPRERGRTERLGEEEERPGRAETLAGSAEALQPIGGPSRRLRGLPAPRGRLSGKPRPTATRPPLSSVSARS